MKIQLMIAYVLLIQIGLAVPSLHADDTAEEPSATLYGEATADAVRLLWRLEQWPEGADGVRVLRRLVDNDGIAAGEWEQVHEGTIGITIERRGPFPGVTDEAESGRLAGVANVMRRVNFKGMQQADLDRLIREDAMWLTRLWGVAYRNYDHARIIGLGMVDHAATPREHHYEYQLRAVMKGDDPHRLQPLDSWISTDPIETLEGPTAQNVRVESSGRTLVWELDPGEAKTFSVTMFKVYRRSEDGSPVALKVSPFRWAFERNGRLQWRYRLPEDVSVERLLLVPVNVFNTELPMQEVGQLSVAPDGNRQAGKAGRSRQPVRIAEVVTSDQGALRVQWFVEDEAGKTLGGFVLERAVASDGKERAAFEVIAEQLPADARSYDDANLPDETVTLHYRLTPLNLQGKPLAAVEQQLLYILTPKPPAVTGLKGEWRYEDGRSYISLEWDPRDPSDDLTAFYVIHTNMSPTGKVTHETGLPRIVDNSYQLEYLSSMDRHVVIRVHGVSHGIRLGDPDEITVTAYSHRLPSPMRLTVEVVADDPRALRLKWDYPDNYFTRGFRILQDGQVVATEEVIKGDTREHRIDGLVKDQIYRFSLHAVSESGRVSSVTQERAGQPGKELPGPMRPRNSKASWREVDDKPVVVLAWDAPSTAFRAHPVPTQYHWQVRGMRKGVRQGEPFDFGTVGGESREAIVEGLDPQKGYFFELWSSANVGQPSHRVPISLLPQGRTLSRPRVGQVRQEKTEDGVQLVLQWSYDSTETLAGFHVYLDGVKVSPDEGVPPELREWKIPNVLQVGDRHRLSFEAFGKNEVSDRSLIYLHRVRPME